MPNHTLHLLQRHGFVVEESGYWGNIPLQKIPQLIPVPSHLQTVVKSRGEHGPLPTFLRQVAVIKSEMSKYLSASGKMSHFASHKVANKRLADDLLIIAFCFFVQFTQCPSFFFFFTIGVL